MAITQKVGLIFSRNQRHFIRNKKAAKRHAVA